VKAMAKNKARKPWSPEHRAHHAATMAAKKEAGLPKVQPPVIFQYIHGKLRILRLQTIEAYIPDPE
jgi:hypothetical protein